MDAPQRQTAFKVRIADILDGSYVQEQGWTPNFIDAGELKISRANVMAIVIAIVEEQGFKNILLDDGSGRISVRIFDQHDPSVDLGDIAMVIGRPREFGGERYLAPEIIKKVDKKWLEVRKLELGEKETVEEQIVDEGPPGERLLAAIKKMDGGDGAPFELISQNISDCETQINRLLELGEIFEVRPGRFKVLE